MLKKIDKLSKHEKLIIKVLDYINNKESKELLEMSEPELKRLYDEINETWTEKREEIEKFNHIQATMQSIDYYADFAAY
jgi:hypothetical protein